MSDQRADIFRVRVHNLLLNDRIFEVGDLVSKEVIGRHQHSLLNGGYIEPFNPDQGGVGLRVSKLIKRLSRVR
jgi:hypothetical protein